MKYKLRMITRESDPNHPAGEEYFDAEFSQVLIVESDDSWWFAKDFLSDLYWQEGEIDFEVNYRNRKIK